MLRYLQPNGNDINMGFLTQSTETKDYILKLRGAQLVPATIVNYLKNMVRFVQFLLTGQTHDQDFRKSCESYIMLLKTLKKSVSKAYSRKSWKTRSIFAYWFLSSLVDLL